MIDRKYADKPVKFELSIGTNKLSFFFRWPVTGPGISDRGYV